MLLVLDPKKDHRHAFNISCSNKFLSIFFTGFITIQKSRIEMKLFSSVLALTSGLEIAKGLMKDVAANLDFFQTVQLRADHLFRDIITMHRENVPDTDKVVKLTHEGQMTKKLFFRNNFQKI